MNTELYRIELPTTFQPSLIEDLLTWIDYHLDFPNVIVLESKNVFYFSILTDYERFLEILIELAHGKLDNR